MINKRIPYILKSLKVDVGLINNKDIRNNINNNLDELYTIINQAPPLPSEIEELFTYLYGFSTVNGNKYVDERIDKLKATFQLMQSKIDKIEEILKLATNDRCDENNKYLTENAKFLYTIKSILEEE